MVIKTASPGVIVNEVDLTRGTSDAITTNVGGFVGPFARGPVDELTLIDGFEEVVDSSEVKAFVDVLFSFGCSRQEDNGYICIPLALLDHLGRFKAIESRHLDIEDDDVDGPLQENTECSHAARRLDHLHPETLGEQSFKSKQVVGIVIDNQNRKLGEIECRQRSILRMG